MSLIKIFDIAGSGMSAQSLRLNTTSSNLANAQSAASSTDQVYRARHPVFSAVQQQVNQAFQADNTRQQASAGVQVLGIVESDRPLDKRYEPEHPLANEEGYVYYPNVNVVEEMANMISASRSFEMNVDTMDAAKKMMQQILTLGQ